MPIIKSAIKRMRQTAKRRERNVEVKKSMKSAVKSFLEKPSAKGLSAAQSEIDTAVKKNILEKRTAARRKSALSKVAKEAGVKIEASAKKKATAPAAKKTAAKPAVEKKAPAKKATASKPAASKTTTAKKAPAKKPAAKK